ncbi:MAG: hypothetical protein ACI9CV_000934 [Ilumatobacter sp.]|jgi:hypothetical protein
MLGESLGEVVGAPCEGMVIIRPDGVVAAVPFDCVFAWRFAWCLCMMSLHGVFEQLLGRYADGEPVGAAPG